MIRTNNEVRGELSWGPWSIEVPLPDWWSVIHVEVAYSREHEEVMYITECRHVLTREVVTWGFSPDGYVPDEVRERAGYLPKDPEKRPTPT